MLRTIFRLMAVGTVAGGVGLAGDTAEAAWNWYNASAGSYGSHGSSGSYGSYGSYGSGGSWGSHGGRYVRHRRARWRGSHGSHGSYGGSWGSSGSYGSYGGAHVVASCGSSGGTVTSYSYSKGAVHYGGMVQKGGAVQQGGAMQKGGAVQQGGAMQKGGATQKGGAMQKGPAQKGGDVMQKSTSYQSAGNGRRAVLRVSVPEDARVFVNDALTRTQGSDRSYVSHNLIPGRSYAYRVRAEVTRDGQTIQETKVASLQAGLDSQLTFELTGQSTETTLTLHVPAEAKVKLLGKEIAGSGEKRVFSTKLLAPGQTWSDYTVEVTVDRDGREVTSSRQLTLQAGQSQDVVFDFDSPQFAAIN